MYDNICYDFVSGTSDNIYKYSRFFAQEFQGHLRYTLSFKYNENHSGIQWDHLQKKCQQYLWESRYWKLYKKWYHS